MSSTVSMCEFCRHLQDGPRCAAFPDGIPATILPDQTIDHRQPVEGDHGIQFEPAEDVDPELLKLFFAARERGWARASRSQP